jgi:UDP:flavonoid glycosyltransferase YjiC (YdhE family)
VPRRILICTVPAAGHVAPGIPIARELVERGHDVHWYTGAAFRAAVEATGATFEPIRAATDPGEGSPVARFRGRERLEGLEAFKHDLKHLFLDEIPGQLADLRRIGSAFEPEMLLVDTGFLAAGMHHELGGPTWATFGITALPLRSRDTAPFGLGLPPGSGPFSRLRNRALSTFTSRVVFRDVQRHHQRVREQVGLRRTRTDLFDSAVSPYLYLHAGTDAFEYPRRDLPPQVHFVGPLLPDPPAVPRPGWWHELDGSRPVVLVTQGTVATDVEQLVVPSLAALADEPVFVVVAGVPTIQRGRLRIPANARVEPFVPFAELMPKVSVMVTNGGYGGVQYALGHGVPLVVAGTTEDKPEIAARVAWSGAGINLRTRTPSAAQVRDAVRTLLDDAAYRGRAHAIRDSYAAHDAPTRAADLIEMVARTGRPATRDALGRAVPRVRATPADGESPLTGCRSV